MKRALSLCLLLAVGTSSADTLLIRNARVHTADSVGTLDGASVLVVDAQGVLVGALNSNDLMRAKVI